MAPDSPGAQSSQRKSSGRHVTRLEGHPRVFGFSGPKALTSFSVSASDNDAVGLSDSDSNVFPLRFGTLPSHRARKGLQSGTDEDHSSGDLLPESKLASSSPSLVSPVASNSSGKMPYTPITGTSFWNPKRSRSMKDQNSGMGAMKGVHPADRAGIRSRIRNAIRHRKP